MQVKKFEAPTIQEALEVIKRELGPEAIILQTKQNKRGFGLMSKASVEVTAAVSERSLDRKKKVDRKMPDSKREQMKQMPARMQADIYNKYADRQITGPTRAASDGVTLDSAAAKLRESVSLSQAASRAAPRPSAPAPRPQGQGIMQKSAAPRQGAGTPLDPSRAVAQPAPAAAAIPAKLTKTRYIDIEDDSSPRSPAQSQGSAGGGVQQEIASLKRMLEELKQDRVAAAQLPAAESIDVPALQDAYEQLIVGGVDKRQALSLIKRVAFELGAERSRDGELVTDQLAAEIMNGVQVRSPLEGVVRRDKAAAGAAPTAAASQGPVVIALVGPTGVGKTTTVAKIASEALLKRGCRVGLINLDSYRVAAFDQLGTYAKILNVPFRSCVDQKELKAALQDFQGLDLVLIDTTGRSQRDPEALRSMQEILQTVPGIRTQLVLSATTRDNELHDSVTRFSAFNAEGITFSKLDEATVYGATYGIPLKAKLPLLYLTTGQKVPEDIEEATPERVAALILGI